MQRKVFVSYKYKDNNVKELPYVTQPTWPCDYVDYIQKNILSGDYIYKGEKSDEDISWWSDDAIWAHLKDKIYDSTITIVLISPNMKESGKWQRSQWIPWEISYSLQETTRNDRTSHNNAILAVILPDKKGTYEYGSGGRYRITAKFRKYSCIEDSMEDHSADLLNARNGSRKRYAGLTDTKSYKRQLQIIKNGGYATSGSYVSQLSGVIARYNLTKWDK